MKAGGSGGANTQTGARFEEATDLVGLLGALPGYAIREKRVRTKAGGFRAPGSYEVWAGDVLVAHIARQNHFGDVLLPSLGIRWQDHVSREAKPDEAIWFPDTRRLVILEKKSQQTSGSTDEKLASGHFRLESYSRLVAPANGTAEFWFVLHPYFSEPKYRDVVQYAKRTGCKVTFQFTPDELATAEGEVAEKRVASWGCLAVTQLPLAKLGFAGHVLPRRVDVEEVPPRRATQQNFAGED